MAQHFWVNNYFIDVSRNQIQHQQQATQLPPKALKVLEVLASRAGEVVSHDELMELVWANSVVGPNTLQRAIAQLRKAFGDDSKQQAFIKTHAKKGYSLEANVRWEEATNQPARVMVEPAASQPASFRYYWLIAVVLALAVVGLWPNFEPSEQLYNQLTPLTASDEQEFNASYSPDGKFLIFNRYEGQCVSHLWAKDLTNNQEVRLSDAPGHYGGLSWSADGSQIAYVLESSCEDLQAQPQRCWQLQTMDFAQAWNGNPNSIMRFNCEQTQTTHPRWLNDGRIALLQYSDGERGNPELVIHDSRNEHVAKVPLDDHSRLYSLDYSRAKNQFASMSITSANEHILRTFTLDGDLINESTVRQLPNQSVYRDLPISFSPDGESLLTEIDGQLFHLDFNGELTPVHIESFNGLSNAIFHPTQPKIAATQGTKDFDVGVLSISHEPADVVVFSRSTEVEINAQFQPNGSLITFASFRSGQRQIWVKDDTRTYQLSQIDEGIRGILYSWSPAGDKLVINVNNQPAILALDGTVDVIESSIAINILMPWTNPSKLLATTNQSGIDQLFSVDVHSGETTALALEDVMWAAYVDDERIVYCDNQKQFWLYTDGNTTPIPQLNGKLYGKRAVIRDGLIYGLDGEHMLWQYNLATAEFNEITRVNKDVIYVSDVNAQQMLATKFIGGRRELVELSASH